MDMKAISPAIGMQVSSIDLTNVSEDDAGALRDALIDRKVLVFRNQPITSLQYVRFMNIFCTFGRRKCRPSIFGTWTIRSAPTRPPI